MPDPNHTIEFALATVGAVFWTAVPLPQIIKSYRTRSTDGLSIWLMIAWTGAGWAWGTYSITEDLAIPIKVNAHAMTFLSSVCTAQILRYSYRKSVRDSIIIFLCAILAWATFEALSIFTLWYAEEHGVTAPTLFYGYVLVNALCISGLIPQFYEIWKAKRVEGISMSMIIFDVIGGSFFAASCFYAPKLDMPGLIFFVAISGLDSVICVLALILNPIAARKDRMKGETVQTTETKLRLDIPSASIMSKDYPTVEKNMFGGDVPLSARPLLYSPYSSSSTSFSSPLTPLTPAKQRDRGVFFFDSQVSLPK